MAATANRVEDAPISRPSLHPDVRAHRLHLALSGLSLFTDGMPDTYITLQATELWAIFSVLADEASTLYEEIIAT